MTCGDCVWWRRVYTVDKGFCGYQVPDWVNQDDNTITASDYAGYCPCFKKKEKAERKPCYEDND